MLVGVDGRAGAGRRTVARALRTAGLTVAQPGATPDNAGDVDVDVYVYVFVETLNADDRAALASAERPVVAVLNKADLTGFGGPGPMAAAAHRCRQLQRATAVPIRPLSALLAVAGTDPAVLDATTIDALRTLGSAALSGAARRELAARLDLFGTACAVSAVRAGAGRADVAALLRGLSGVAEVCAAIDRAAAPVRYRRLAALAAADPRAAAADEPVLARMEAAAVVLGAAGATDPDCLTPSDQLRRAIHWQRYARGPVSALHWACARDVARGALRLWARAGGVPAGSR